MKIPKILKNIHRKRWFRVTVACLLFVLLIDILFLNYTEPTQLGIARNRISGRMWVQEGGGWHISPPWVWVVRIDTRPMRVSVPSGGRGYSAKLVQFVPSEWKEFVQTEGWRFYWWSNRLSFNWGYGEEHRGVKDILRGYAYGPKQYKFIRVLQEYQTSQ